MRTAISRLTVLIILLSSLCAAIGIFSNNEYGSRLLITINDEAVETYGIGVYKNDSVSVASQAIAQDIITMIMGVPLLIISLFLSRKSLKGLFLLTGTLGYFLYTYMSYCFCLIYNNFFLLYVILMSSSLFAFILCIVHILKFNMNDCFKNSINSRFIGGFMIFLAVSLGFLWLGRIIPTITSDAIPYGIEYYTTLPVQALDLGLIATTAFLAGILTLRRKPMGYLLSSIMVMKGITLTAAITAMAISMTINGVEVSLIEFVVFPLFCLLAIFCLVIIVRNIKEPKDYASLLAVQ